MDNIAIARQLSKGEKSIIKQFTGIFDKFREWQAFNDGVTINRAWLAA